MEESVGRLEVEERVELRWKRVWVELRWKSGWVELRWKRG